SIDYPMGETMRVEVALIKRIALDGQFLSLELISEFLLEIVQEQLAFNIRSLMLHENQSRGDKGDSFRPNQLDV
ncbi:hypothetical protein PMAYCL1PPCAC_22299, partial [Pristionchus mayeri]